MTYQYLQRHSILRFTLCLVVACLCCFGFFAPPIVTTAYAEAITTAGIISVIGTIFAFFGITFASYEEMSRAAMSFYNNSSSAIKGWVDGTVLKFPTPPSGDPNKGSGWGNNINIPASMMTGMVAALAAFFAKDKPPVIEDTSGIGVPDWKSQVGRTLGNYSGYLPIPVIINSLPAYSPNAIASYIPIQPSMVPLLGTDYFPNNPNAVLRMSGLSLKTYDYKLHILVTPTNIIMELSENGNYICKFHYSLRGSS